MGKEVVEKNEVVESKFEMVDYGKKVEEFKAANENFDMDFVELGTMVKLNAKGQFQSKDDETLIFDEMKVVILEGKSQFVLWGKEGTPREDELIFAVDDIEEAESRFENLVAEDEVFEEMYEMSDVSKRYIIMFVAEDGELYGMNMPQTSKYEFGTYAKSVFRELKTGVNKVITRMKTEARTRDKNSWNVVTFELIGKLDD